jgi:hypothetical protein
MSQSVSVEHYWKQRAERAEAEVKRLKEENASLKALCREEDEFDCYIGCEHPMSIDALEGYFTRLKAAGEGE